MARLRNPLQLIFPWFNRVVDATPEVPGSGLGEGYYNQAYYESAYYGDVYYPKPPGGSETIVTTATFTIRQRSAAFTLTGGT